MSERIVSLFSGIGGLEFGFHKLGRTPLLFCENDLAAQAVLGAHFPDVPISHDVSKLKRLPACDLLLAGFPCQDLSQAGGKAGIGGTRSGLVAHLFRLIATARPKPKWLVVENVPYMLSLEAGSAMKHLVSELEELGYMWAYRVVDARAFGTPQRRPRVIMVASRTEDPRQILFSGNQDPGDIDGKPSDVDESAWYGFYWTEGSRGVGWAKEGVPPIKGGSTIGIASPPAIWIPERDFVGTITLNDAERLQGFAADWTAEVEQTPGLKKNARWRLVGNAVNTGMSTWLASRFENPTGYDGVSLLRITGDRWPKAAWGHKGKAYTVSLSQWPAICRAQRLSKFLKDPLKPLSVRATSGFLKRALLCTNITYSKRFLNSLQTHADSIISAD
jgi:DNA (cytosine-5)-methyltransferase 1